MHQEEQPQVGDIVEVSLVGEIMHIYQEEGFADSYLLLVHGTEVPILAIHVQQILSRDVKKEAEEDEEA